MADRKTTRGAGRRRSRVNRLVTVALASALVVLIAIGVLAQSDPAEKAEAEVTVGPPVLRPDSHRLSSAPDGRVTFVEFLDFECEACGAVYPAIEQLRERYAGRVTFVARYFPLVGHFNSQRAARAVEAAARQGKFEAMYAKLFQTQPVWAEQQVPKDDVFRGYAAELGLDMKRWDADYGSDQVWARIQADIDDGNALGLTGTPGFFLNGQRIEPQSVQDLIDAFDQALAQR